MASERNKFTKELNKNIETFQAEISEYQTTINELETQLLLERKERQKAQVLANELKEAKSALNE